MISFAHSIYCDDIRFEHGNKVSLMGCYSGMLLFEGNNVILPKLGIFVTVNLIPTDIPKELIVKIIRDDGAEEILSQVYPVDAEIAQQVHAIDDVGNSGDSDQYFTMKVPIVLSPVELKDGKISTRIYYDDKVLKAGSLLVRRGVDADAINVS